MQQVTFPCPQCGKRMAVGLELTGRSVRCPNCRHVVVAPAASQPGPPAAKAPPGPGADLTPTMIPRPSTDFVVSITARESSESIFSDPEESEDSVFTGAAARKPELPPGPEAQQPTDKMRYLSNLTGQPTPAPTRGSPPSSGWLAPTPITPPSAPALEVPAIVPVAVQPHADTAANPFSDLAGPVPVGDASPWQAIDADDPPPPPEPPKKPSASAKPTAAPAGPVPRSQWWKYAVMGALAVYALVVTVVAAWGWLRGGESGHPLSTIPDFFGEYGKADRKKVSQVWRQYFKPDDDLPPQLRVGLGQTIAVGQLEITPLAVEERKPLLVTRFSSANATPSQKSLDACLALKLRLRNLSDDVEFCPVDPAFQTKPKPNAPAVSGLYVGKSRFPGSPVDWPFGAEIQRVYADGQENENVPLAPGATQDYVVYSVDDKKLVAAVRGEKDPMMWKLLLRRGTVRYRFSDVSVTTLVGVEFRAADVKWLPPRPAGETADKKPS
ncbi:hypothetical protein [Fimbriiglobus ruber]|uniref:Uncharacterized protein n=1 Tax=Fimbriiglobus ruber TaxID=1908690 RepID=A0A225EAS5_9BACT|nr:hypothetical protein [Fimbriiglobus ruber]OWK46489.1 hypothetical protein FRUB_00188 [Fimbriiglobus ruber]